jgi:hypothetical protein
MANTHPAHTRANTPYSGACIKPATSPPTRDRRQYRANTTPLAHNAIDSAAHVNVTISKPANTAKPASALAFLPARKQTW